MKKIISVILCFCFVAALCGCNQTAEEETSLNSSDGFVSVSVVCEKTEVAAGEDVTVALNIKNAMFTACFDIFVYASEELDYVSAETELINNQLMLAANYMEGEVAYVAVRGIVATAFDIDDKNVCTIVYKVPENAKTGDTFEIKVECPVYQLAVDSSGNDVYDVNETVVTNSLTLTVV